MSRFTFVLALSFFIAASSASTADRHVKYVVLVSVDGLSASYLTDQRAQMSNLRSMAKQGVSAQGMVTTFPSVTWPSHTSLITGTFPARHGVIGNSVWNRETQQEIKYIGDPVLSKDEATRVPTLYDVAHKAGLSTASVIWPCSNGTQTLNWVIPDSNRTEIHTRYVIQRPGSLTNWPQPGSIFPNLVNGAGANSIPPTGTSCTPRSRSICWPGIMSN